MQPQIQHGRAVCDHSEAFASATIELPPSIGLPVSRYPTYAMGFTASGLRTVRLGLAFFGASKADARVPDLVGIVQHGVVYTGGTGKIAEHGGGRSP